MDYRIWIRNYLKHPIQLGSLLPSSAKVGDLIVDHIRPNNEGPILELGAGTGRVTNAILRKGIKQSNLVLVEKSPDFCRLLNNLFPEATVLCADAMEIDRLSSDLGIEGYKEIVSAIPLRMISSQVREAIFLKSLNLLKHKGSFSQVTFLPRCPIPDTVIQSASVRLIYNGMSFRNLPPAFVWRVEKIRA